MKTKVFVSILTLLIFLGGAILSPVAAAEFEYESGERFVEYTDDVDDDLYISGDQNVSVEGNINGDLFVAGGTVDIDGDVTGTVYTAGGTIKINGKVDKNVFATGGQVYVNGDVGRDIFGAAGTLEIEGNVIEDVMVTGGQVNISGNVGDDLRAAGGILKIEGEIAGDLLVGGGQVDIRGDVLGDARIAGDSVVIRSEKIGGDLKVYGDEDMVDIKDETEIGGDFKIEEPKYKESEEVYFPGLGLGLLGLSGFALFLKIIFTFVQALGLVLLGWLVSKFAPVKLESTLMKMNSWGETGRSLGLGFVAIPAGFFLAIFLGLTVIGWPTLGVLFALFSVASALVVPVVGLSLGRWILDQFDAKRSVVLPLFIGIFLIQLIRLIPILGSLVYMVIFLIGIGAMLRMQYEKYQKAHGKK